MLYGLTDYERSLCDTYADTFHLIEKLRRLCLDGSIGSETADTAMCALRRVLRDIANELEADV